MVRYWNIPVVVASTICLQSNARDIAEYAPYGMADGFVRRVLNGRPLQHIGLDDTTLGKVALVPPAQAAVTPPVEVVEWRFGVPPKGPAFMCPAKFEGVFADMKDGDMKEVTISGSMMTIKPKGNDQRWVVNTAFDRQTCSAPAIDFNVPGKPGYPPVPIAAQFWSSAAGSGSATVKKAEFEFTDPRGTLAKPDVPLNRWVQLGTDGKTEADLCPQKFEALFYDMHDGDQKKVVIDGTTIEITPYKNEQTWIAKGTLDPKSCSAAIDFNVPGKANPPPVAIKASLLSTKTVKNSRAAFDVTKQDGGTEKAFTPSIITKKKSEFEFTDPSGKLAKKDFPLNHWVQFFPPMDMSMMEMPSMSMPMDMKSDMKETKMEMDMKGMKMPMDMKLPASPDAEKLPMNMKMPMLVT